MNNKIFLLSILFSSSIYTQSIENLNSFSNMLYEKKEYFRAITEFKRINSYYPDNKNFIKNKISIAICFYKAGHPIEAVSVYKEIFNTFPNHWESVYSSAEILSEISYFYESNTLIESQIKNFSGIKKDSLLYLNAFNCIKQKKIDNARILLDSIDEKSILFSKSQQAKTLLDQYNDLDYKNRKLAGILNLFIPGAGYLYTGMRQTGISTFLLEYFLIHIWTNSHKQKTTGTSLLTGFVFTGIHLGAVYGSLQQTDKKNKKLFLDYSNKFKLERIK